MLALYLAYLDDESDKKLFEEIYLSHRKQMVILAITILGSEDDAQDAVGDVFLRIAQKNWDTYTIFHNNLRCFKHIKLVGLCKNYTFWPGLSTVC